MIGHVERVEKVADEVHFTDAVSSRSATGPSPELRRSPQEVLNGADPERSPVPEVHVVVNAESALLTLRRGAER